MLSGIDTIWLLAGVVFAFVAMVALFCLLESHQQRMRWSWKTDALLDLWDLRRR